jgi:hypothetical protein
VIFWFITQILKFRYCNKPEMILTIKAFWVFTQPDGFLKVNMADPHLSEIDPKTQDYLGTHLYGDR